MGIKKRHHTIPKCYLENFTDENGKVWVLDIKDKIFDVKPENILVEKHFYTITIKSGEKSLIVEDTLANIEGAYISIFRDKIEKRLPLTIEEKAKVSVFIAAMFLRTKSTRENLKSMFQQLRDTIIEWKEQSKNLSEEQKRVMAATPSSGGEKIELEDIDNYLNNSSEYHSMNIIEQLPGIAQIIFDMKWSIWVDENDGFVTSDRPVVLLRPESIKKYGARALGSTPGLLYKDVELTIPLSKNRLLLAGWLLNEDTYVNAMFDWVEKVNHRTITGSSERIITKSKKEAEDIKNKYTETIYKNKQSQ